MDTNFSTSQFTAVLNILNVTACIKIPELRDTLAEKHVTKILKRFTISATTCVFFIKPLKMDLTEGSETSAKLNPSAPSDPYMGRTAQLTSRCHILNTYSTNIRTEYF
jgi:hypothetical protein